MQYPIKVASFEKIRKLCGKQNEGFRLEAKMIKDGVQLSEKREDSWDSRMM